MELSLVEPPKTPQFDELNKKITQEACINVLCEYEKELQRIYSLYISENIKYGKMVFSDFLIRERTQWYIVLDAQLERDFDSK